MSIVTYREKNNPNADFSMMLIAASCANNLPASASALAAATMHAAPGHHRSEPALAGSVKGPSLLSQLLDLVAEYRRYRRLVRKAGKNLEIPFYKARDIEAEVQRHRWIEAEKAGRDIWIEKDPTDPDGVALRDWVSRHYDKWKNAQTNQIRQMA